MFPGLTLALLLLPSLLSLSASATQASERISEAVELKLYPMQVSDWSSTKQADFAAALASQATSYCAASQLECGASNTLTFNSSEVGVSSLEDSSKSMLLTFYLDYPGSPTFYSNSSTQYVLPASVAQEIAREARDSVKNLTGAYITYIDNVYYGIPPDSTMNAIIIPITIISVCILGIVAILLVNRQKNQEREETIRARQAEKKKYGTTQSGPSYNILESTDTTFMSTPTTPRNAPGSNKVAPDSYAIWTGESEAVTSKTDTTPSFAAPLPQDDGGAVPLTKNGSLTPLYSVTESKMVDEDEARREKKRKKERKREKRRLQNDSLEMNNSGLDNSCLTVTDSDSRSNIPTFTVERGTIA